MSLYDSPRWRATRKKLLARDSLCQHCLRAGRIKLATVADHIQPWKTPEEFFCGLSGLQGLCVPCHSKKTNQDIAKNAEKLNAENRAKKKAEKTKAYYF